MPLLAAVLACESSDSRLELERRRAAALEGSDPAAVDFASVGAGDTVLGLRVDSLDILPDPVDGSGWMGVVQFSGEVALSGEYRPHPDFPAVRETCFFADGSSGARLPRFPNDARRPWLCFANPVEAARILGEPGVAGRARIRIDHFEYHYRHTDVYNVGRLVAAEPLPAPSAILPAAQEPRR